VGGKFCYMCNICYKCSIGIKLTEPKLASQPHNHHWQTLKKKAYPAKIRATVSLTASHNNSETKQQQRKQVPSQYKTMHLLNY
jgi:hypothetical protein